jgi:hypothetical protein
MTRYEMFRVLFEPPNGWHDEETCRLDFQAFEKSKGQFQALASELSKHEVEEDDGTNPMHAFGHGRGD